MKNIGKIILYIDVYYNYHQNSSDMDSLKKKTVLRYYYTTNFSVSVHYLFYRFT